MLANDACKRGWCEQKDDRTVPVCGAGNFNSAQVAVQETPAGTLKTLAKPRSRYVCWHGIHGVWGYRFPGVYLRCTAGHTRAYPAVAPYLQSIPTGVQQKRPRRSIKEYDGSSRDKLRKDCQDIGREHRKTLLQQHRPSLSPGELQAKLHQCSMAAIRAELVQTGSKGALLTEADIDGLLADIEQQVLQEIQAELAALEHSEQQDQQRAVAMAEEHMHFLQSAGEEAVLCPVCRAAHLAQRHGRLVCPAEGWQLNLAAESLRLSDLKGRLAAAYEEHAVSGCSGQLQFHIEDIIGSSNLTCCCDTCQVLTVVL
ncbi:replication protein A interacting C-terminal-domain-containing protein [Scenedesmus sp. NREL 46B-D3]|nr:replication protein A interacting C-terminal-domain-containing protein [Scenedesmus sp. NREL 46B-D3]